ncbi:conjugal transfer protein [Sinirhodobacter populi]|uniref:Conjugal transfer protein n=1 Tax=Paenirhodobacter populi TaxID=2306993 RepID=A0A443KCM3_9RHOB|nr:conjugative transfer system coupling protein TraD [Sinirhodobacter populi]RWR30561.1 conjugal transfer protein [Sinirhodobacter populi]
MLNYETDYRPNYEMMLASAWGACGVGCAGTMIFYSGFPFVTTAIMTSVFFAASGYQAFFAQARRARMDKLEKAEQNFYSMDALREQMRDGALFLGRGFEWTIEHAQKVSDLYRDPRRLAEIKKNRKGGTFLHGVGMADEDVVFVNDDESKGHVHIVGTTGSGKTRCFDLLVTQCILRGEPVIFIDPKGDHELKNNMEMAYRRLGRGRDFVFFHPAFVEESAAINPLATYQRSSEIASRLASIIPTSSSGDAFQSFSHNALNAIFYAVEAAGQRPTIFDAQRVLAEGFGPLCVRALLGWSYSMGPEIHRKMTQAMGGKTSQEDKAFEGARFYQEISRVNPSLSLAEMNNLCSLLLHDKTHFQKMVSSLVPAVGKLCSGPLAALFSPDPQADRMPKSGKVISLKHVIDTAGGCYIGLDTLSDVDVGRAMGQMILSDLASQAGGLYNFPKDGRKRFINIFIDEAGEIANEPMIQLLNKGRGASIRMFVATQTLADYEVRTDSKAKAMQIISNMNNVIMLRTVEPETQERLAKRLPEVPIQYVMKTTASSMGDNSITGAFAKNHGERLMSEDKPIFAPQSLGDLSDLEYFAILSKSNYIKGRFPILEAPEEDYHAPRAEHYSEPVRSFRYDYEAIEETKKALSPEVIAAERPREKPPVLDVELEGYLVPPPIERRRWLPIFSWVNVFPTFRKGDRVEPVEDRFVKAHGWPDDEERDFGWDRSSDVRDQLAGESADFNLHNS